METIGERVRRVREDLGISRADLAKQIGAKGESYISELELGGIKKGGRLHQIADALGVSVKWLETGKGEQSPPDASDDNITPSFARLLAAANIDHSVPVTQAAIARALGVSPQTVSAWRTNGVSKDGADYAATKFNVPAAWIMYGTGMLFAQSQPARLTGDMILSAYRAARKAITLTGLEADDFSPDSDPVDADILARAILQQMAEQSTAGSPGHTEPEVGHGGSHRQDGRAGGAEGAAEAGRESKPAAGKSRKHAA